MTDFFSRLNYSIGNEDWRVEDEALAIEKDSDVLCITASGDRPLHLMLNDCRSITSIDANPIQNQLLRLKCAALKSLDFEDYLSFLGAKKGGNRKELLDKVSLSLDKDSEIFWKSQVKKIDKGIIYQGDIERLAKYVAMLAKLIWPRKIKKLFSFKDLEEQKKFIDEEWDTYFLRKVFELCLSPYLSRLLANDPGLYSHVDPSIKLGSYIYERMLTSMKSCLARENLLVSLLFQGYLSEDSLPPYLTPNGYLNIREKMDRLHIETNDVIRHLKTTPIGSYDRFSMSDIASYMDQSSFDQLIQWMYQAAKPGSRFCIRQFSSNHKIPDDYLSSFKREPALEQELERKENCFVYRFMVGIIEK